MTTGSVALALVNEADIPLLDLYEASIACAIFGVPQPDLADPWYDLKLCAVNPVKNTTGNGFFLRTSHGLAELTDAKTVIIPSVPDACIYEDQELPPEFITAIQKAHANGARIVSLCNGVFALAAAGLLNGRRATAHWIHTPALARKYPKVQIDDSMLYVDNGDVLTSGGLSAGLDLCLHIVRQDLGAHVANILARRMVVAAHRSGGQAQFVHTAIPPVQNDSLSPTLQWATQHLNQPLTVDELAKKARMSTRTFFRRLQAATGTTPLKWLLHQRLARAQTLLETTNLPIEKVSQQSGLGTAANLRRHFSLQFGVTPMDYRRAFHNSE